MTTPDNQSYSVEVLSPSRTSEALDVLCDSFYDYPVMRHVVGEVGEEYDHKLRTLIGFFLAARVLREEPMLAVEDEGRVVAIAILTSPGDGAAPPALAEKREIVWAELGQAARERYEALGEIWAQFTIPESHYHLNMIGVARTHGGSGLGR